MWVKAIDLFSIKLSSLFECIETTSRVISKLFSCIIHVFYFIITEVLKYTTIKTQIAQSTHNSIENHQGMYAL